MAWWEVSLHCTNEQAELTSEKLESLGALAVRFTNLNSALILEPDPDQTPLWEKVQCIGLFEKNITKANLKHHLEKISNNFNIYELPEQDWMQLCYEQSTPQCFGQHLWVCPSWSTVSDAGAIVLKLDPGLAFGTGTHPTTHLCLTYLATHDIKDKRVIDFGCGSGILGIGAALLGAQAVICIDHDHQALISTKNNSRNNQVEDKITCYHSSQFQAENNEPVDLLIANILTLPLIELAPIITLAVKFQGTLVLSGLLSQQIDLVLNAYVADFDFETPQIKDDWICLIGKKT